MAFNVAFQTAPVTATTTTELSVLATPAVAYYPTGTYQGVAVTGVLNASIPTAATTVVVKVKNGSGTAGTVIGVPMTISTNTMATLYNIPFAVVDTTNPPATQYNVTFTNGVSASSVIENAFVWVDPVQF